MAPSNDIHGSLTQGGGYAPLSVGGAHKNTSRREAKEHSAQSGKAMVLEDGQCQPLQQNSGEYERQETDDTAHQEQSRDWTQQSHRRECAQEGFTAHAALSSMVSITTCD